MKRTRSTQWSLAPREVAAMDAAVSGKRNGEAAAGLGVATKTYSNTLCGVYEKMRYYEDAPDLTRWHCLNLWREYRKTNPIDGPVNSTVYSC